ncbi:MAG: DNA polymerase III subunit beta [Treponema sp.]|nr:DNA polymerase III subunit beta [Treponema sp.]
MKFTFDRDAMIKEISIAQEIITNKSPLSILSNILLIAKDGTLTIKATDSSVNFITQIPVDIIEEGSTTIFCDKFMGFLSNTPSGEVEFEQNDIKVIIKPTSKKIKFQLNSIASAKFADVPAANDVPFFEFSSKEFKQMIEQTIISVSEDVNRFFLTGVYFTKQDDKFVMVSTDAKRLSIISKDLPGVDFPSSIVPTKVLKCILKNASDEGNIQIAIVDKLIFFRFANYEFSSKLIEGQYPNYQKVIPESQSFTFQVLKSDLESALRMTDIMIDKKYKRILFKLTPGNLTLISPESEIGTADEEIPCRYDGEEVTIVLNNKYITDDIKNIDTEYVAFEFTDPGKAITIRPEPAEDYFHIVMPIRITN